MSKFDYNKFFEDAWDFIKEHVLCVRDIYKPVSFTNRPASGRPIPTAFFAPGDTLNPIISSIHLTELRGDHDFEYKFKYTKTEMRSHDLEIHSKYGFCCGCVTKLGMGAFHWTRPLISKEIPNQEGENSFQLALKKMEEISTKQNVGCYQIIQIGQLNEELREELFPIVKEELEKIRPKVPFLILKAREGNYRPYVDFISYEHLALNVEDEEVTITDKMINCGFLSVNAVLTNREKLEEFRGFGLIIGQASRNSFSVDRFYEEIEKSLNNDPSSFECFGLFDMSVNWKSFVIMDKLKSYSSNDMVHLEHGGLLAIEFNDEKDSAIVFRGNEGACFVTNGRQKWYDVLDMILATLNQ